MSRVFLAVLACSILSVPLLAQQTAAPKHECGVQNTKETDGDHDLARRKYSDAFDYYTNAIKEHPDSLDDRLGLVRALIGLDKVDEARQAAAGDVAKWPTSAVAEVAAGEAAYRAADFAGMQRDAGAAIREDHCDGRVFALGATFLGITARYATAATYLDKAHQLRPDDVLIRRRWSATRTREQRAAVLESKLHGANPPSGDDAKKIEDTISKLRAPRTNTCRVTSKRVTTQIPFVPDFDRPGHFSSFGLDISINGSKRHMLIDTGASGIILTPDAAKKLGLKPEREVSSGGVGDEGRVSSYLAHVESIKIGDVELSNCVVDVLEKSQIGGDGLIGLDVFARWIATLDFAHRKLLLNPLPPLDAKATADSARDDDDGMPHDAIMPPGMQDWIHIVRLGHTILMPAALEKGPVHYMIADTGASQTGLSTNFARTGGHLQDAENVTITGISGRVNQVYLLPQATLYFGGHFELPPMNYYAHDFTSISHNEGVEVSGLIGLPTLAQLSLTIDYRDNLVRLDFDPKAHH